MACNKRSITTILEEFERCTNRNGPTPSHCPELGQCWEWGRVPGLEKKPNAQGYSYVSVDRTPVTGHRLVAKFIMGFSELSKNDVVIHKCDNRICVNPHHLEVSTHSGNVADKVSKDRQNKGSAVGMGKLTEADIPGIWLDWWGGVEQQEIAKRLDVDPSTISYITRGRTWTHVPKPEKPVGSLR